MKSLTGIFFFLFLFSITNAQQQDTLWLKEHADTLRYKTAKEIKQPKPLQKKIRPEPVELKRNLISVNMLDLMLKNISFSVDFVPGDGKFGITMPLTFYSPLGKAIENFNSSDMGKYHKELATYIRAGFDFNYYPIGQKKYTPVTGVSMQGAYMKRDVDVQVDENKGVYQGLYFYFMGKTGLQCTYWNRFTLSFIVHAGVKTPDVQTWYFGMLGNVGVGVRF
ncbi:MAG: hypothetical protein POELPBGB_01686 [Bacteroidia bacterium]|nr:hypothetical protein [Bacteroidia bacterium]